jgi:hypothetical protein
MKCINLKNEKKISFSSDTKKYDGSSYKNIIYSEIIYDLLNDKINTKNDILDKTKNIKIIYFILIESYKIVNKLEELKEEYMQKNISKTPILKCGSRDIIFKFKPKDIVLLNKLIEILEDIEMCNIKF